MTNKRYIVRYESFSEISMLIIDSINKNAVYIRQI